MQYILFAIKKIKPLLFGRIIYNSVTNTKKLQNISIAGISPEQMDYNDKIMGDGVALLEILYNIEGILGIDTTRCTLVIKNGI